MSIFKKDSWLNDIKDGWLNYLKAAGPKGGDPEVEEIALERAEVCKGCDSLKPSGLFRFINQLVEREDGSKVHRKIRHIIKPDSEDAQKFKEGKLDPDDVVRGYACSECGCGFPANVYAPNKKCPLDKWKR